MLKSKGVAKKGTAGKRVRKKQSGAQRRIDSQIRKVREDYMLLL